MTLLGGTQLLIFLAVSAFSYFTNKDIFSPVKWYLVTILIYFGSIYWGRYSLEIHATYFLFILLGAVFVVLEKRNSLHLTPFLSNILNGRRFAEKWWLIWVLTIPSLIANFYMVFHFGGSEAYISSIDLRVTQWSGLGFWLLLISFSKTLNLIYFCIGLISGKRILSAWWMGFYLHLTLTLTLNLLSGGRGRFLGVFVAMVIAFHYLKRPIKLSTALVFGSTILFIAMIMGVARTGLTLDEDGLRTGYSHTSEAILETNMFSYGLWPLEILYNDSPDTYQMGSTYLAGLTNLIPRQLWSDKPKSGGVVLTEFQRGKDYIGTSHITPGAIGEGIINFGTFAGIVIGFFVLIISFFIAISIYKKFLHTRVVGGPVFLYFGLYYYLHELPASLVKGEFANMLTTKILAIAFLFFLLRILKYRFT